MDTDIVGSYQESAPATVLRSGGGTSSGGLGSGSISKLGSGLQCEMAPELGQLRSRVSGFSMSPWRGLRVLMFLLPSCTLVLCPWVSTLV